MKKCILAIAALAIATGFSRHCSASDVADHYDTSRDRGWTQIFDLLAAIQDGFARPTEYRYPAERPDAVRRDDGFRPSASRRNHFTSRRDVHSAAASADSRTLRRGPDNFPAPPDEDGTYERLQRGPILQQPLAAPGPPSEPRTEPLPFNALPSQPQLVPPHPHAVLPQPRELSLQPPPLPIPVFERFQPGDFVDCAVPLYPWVKVEDADDIAPGAMPVLVAVRDPRNRRGIRCVFVKVYVPNYPPRRVKVDDHGTELKLDYGKYEIEIEADDGRIEIEYDD